MRNFIFITTWFFLMAAPTIHGATLESAFQMALQKNETVAIEQEHVEQSTERVNQVRGAILPTINANYSYMLQPSPNDPALDALYPNESKTFSLSATQPLFRGFREFAVLRQQKNLLRVQERTRVVSLTNLYREVAGAYLQVLALQGDLTNLKAQSQLMDERVGELQARVRRGESSSTETITAQSSRASLAAEIQLVSGQLEVAKVTLATITGLPADESLSDPELAPLETNLISVNDFLGHIEEREDIEIAKELAQSESESVSIAKGAHWPTLDLLGNYYFSRPDGTPKGLDWDVQLRLTLPLYEGGIRQSQVREASSKRSEAELKLSQARKKAEQEIRNLHRSFQARKDQVKALNETVKLTEKNYQLILRDYRRGLTRNLDVQSALTEWRVTRRTLDQARFASQLDHLNLQLAAGRYPPALMKEVKR